MPWEPAEYKCHGQRQDVSQVVQSLCTHHRTLSQTSGLFLPLSIYQDPLANQPQQPLVLHMSSARSVTRKGSTCTRIAETGSWPLAQTHPVRTCRLESSNLCTSRQSQDKKCRTTTAGQLTAFSLDAECVLVQNGALQRGIAHALATLTPVALRLLIESISSQ